MQAICFRQHSNLHYAALLHAAYVNHKISCCFDNTLQCRCIYSHLELDTSIFLFHMQFSSFYSTLNFTLRHVFKLLVRFILLVTILLSELNLLQCSWCISLCKTGAKSARPSLCSILNIRTYLSICSTFSPLVFMSAGFSVPGT